MTLYHYLILLVSLSAIFAYINQRWIKLPFVIGLFLLSTILSAAVIISGNIFHLPVNDIKSILETADIDNVILNILLGFLLFAGALHTDWGEIKGQLKAISIFAVGGTILSTLIVAGLLFMISGLLHLNISFLFCMLFGALISPPTRLQYLVY